MKNIILKKDVITFLSYNLYNKEHCKYFINCLEIYNLSIHNYNSKIFNIDIGNIKLKNLILDLSNKEGEMTDNFYFIF